MKLDQLGPGPQRSDSVTCMISPPKTQPPILMPADTMELGSLAARVEADPVRPEYLSISIDI